MTRILKPLSEKGALAVSMPKGRLPVTLIGQSTLKPSIYKLPIPSAQIKSALLLAGLTTKGKTQIEEPIPCRKHTENMLRFFGADLSIDPVNQTQKSVQNNKDFLMQKSCPHTHTIITLKGPAHLQARQFAIPSDPSSAAFPIIAALLLEQAEIQLSSLLNAPERTGFLRILKNMGAHFTIHPNHTDDKEFPFIEKTFNIQVYSSRLNAIHLSKEEVPSVIDEIPILAVAAAFANGTSQFDGLSELRFKESDRLKATLTLLQNSGVTAKIDSKDTLIIKGCFPKKPFGNAHCITHYDHRLAMSALIMGAAAQNAVSIDDSSCIATSFPEFLKIMCALGADFRSTSKSKIRTIST